MGTGSDYSYAYSALGKRIGKEVKGQATQYLYNAAQILVEYSSTKAIKARYVHGAGLDEVLTMVRLGKFSYLHQDGLGSVTTATDDRGLLVEDYRYRAFGEPTLLDAQGKMLTESAISNPFLFTGREWDQETSLYYYRNRYYAQTVGRFLTQDSFPGNASDPGSWHRYSYVENNPINYLDPLGLRAEAAEQPSRMSILQGWNQGSGGFTPAPAPLPPGGFTPSPGGSTAIIDPIPERLPQGSGGFTPAGPPERPGGFTPSEPGSTAFYDKEEGGEGPKDPPPIPEDPREKPGPEWIWRGEGEQGGREGNWWNPGTDEWIHNEPDSPSHGPHRDYRDREGNEWRKFPDGTWERK